MGRFFTTWNDQVCAVDGNVTLTPIEHALRQETYGGDVVWKAVTGQPKTLIVHLHSFSGDETEITVEPARSALLSIPDAVLVGPRLFGPAGGANTCGAPAQLALLKSIIDTALAEYGCSRVILTGVSGGAGLGATFLGAYPGVASGASLWVGYYSLATWYSESEAAGHIYDDLMRNTFGGAPVGALAAAYLAQSPAGTLSGARNCVVYLNDGLLDAEIPSHHRTDTRDQLVALPASAQVDCRYVAYPNKGHADVVDYNVLKSQVEAIIQA